MYKKTLIFFWKKNNLEVSTIKYLLSSIYHELDTNDPLTGDQCKSCKEKRYDHYTVVSFKRGLIWTCKYIREFFIEVCNGADKITRGPGEADSGKTLNLSISWHFHFKKICAILRE
jgi:hypothetical protein